MNQTAYLRALEFNPDIVVIMLGTNDDLIGARKFNSQFEADYTTLVTSFQELSSHPQVLIADPPPIYNNSADLSPAFLSDRIIPQTENVANNLNLPVVDVYSAFCDHIDYYNPDQIHPNSEGSAVIASTVCDAINIQQASTYNPADESNSYSWLPFFG